MSLELEALREVGLFGGLNDAAVESLAHAHELMDVPAGGEVFREGDPGREMFVVLEGEIALTKSVPGGDALIASVSKNDWFGEMSMLDILPRPTTARVIARARLLRLTAHDLDVLYRRDPKAYTLLVLNIAREMSRRLRAVDSALASIRGERDGSPST